jgi:hypothetical protein
MKTGEKKTTGFRQTLDVLEKWNETTSKLTKDDMRDIASKVSMGSAYQRRSSWKRITLEDRCKHLIEIFEANDNRMPRSVVKARSGKQLGTVINWLKENGYEMRIEHEFHGNKPMSYYRLEKKVK